MILIGLGANIPSKVGAPQHTLEVALERMDTLGIRPEKTSRWYRTSPVPASDQSDFINGVVSVRADFPPDALLAALHKLEDDLGRTRRQKWEARPIDLDILAYHELSTLESLKKEGQSIQIPHPRLHERRFVLTPLAEIAPEWVHPVLGQTARELLEGLADQDRCEPLS